MKTSRIFFPLLAVATLMMTGCATDVDLPAAPAKAEVEEGDFVYTLSLNLKPESRALPNEFFDDGDVTYYSFHTASGDAIRGYAVYSTEASLWELHTSAPISNNTFGKVHIAYFGHDCRLTEWEGNLLILDPQYPVYTADDVDYIFHNKMMEINTTLTCRGARFRLTSDGNTTGYVGLTGVYSFSEWNSDTGQFTFSDVTSLPFLPGVSYPSFTPYYTLIRKEYGSTPAPFRVVNGTSIILYNDSKYDDMFAPGSTSTFNLGNSGYKYNGASYTISTKTLTNSSPNYALQYMDYWSFYSGGFHIKAKIKVSEYYGEPGTQKIIFLGQSDSTISSTKYGEYTVLDGETFEKGVTYDVDWDFCNNAYVGASIRYYFNIAFANVKFTISDITMSSY